MKFPWGKLQQWYKSSPARAIDRAYAAALKIQRLENDYFGGNPIANDGTYGSSTFTVLQTQLQNHLNTIRLKLLEYKLSNMAPGNWGNNILDNLDLREKLTIIDSCLERYESQLNRPIVADTNPNLDAVEESTRSSIKQQIINNSRPVYRDRTIVPPSLLSTAKKIASVLSPNIKEFEQGIVDEIEQTRRRTFAAIRFFVSLIILTIALQWGSKTFIYSPLVDFFNAPRSVEIKFQDHFKTEALEEFRLVQESIEFEGLVSELNGIPIDKEQQKAKLREEAEKLVISYNYRSLEGIKNLFADLTSGLIIYGIITFGREQIAIVRDFFYETLASLSDSAKAFLIIVSTDTFVGYHSSDGWDALLKALFYHFGLPESKILTDTFIATVPVFLDALFKFWIFQYLRRASPPTSAIYREMND